MTESRLARQLQRTARAFRDGALAREEAIRQCVRLGFTPSEAATYLLRSTASTASITAPATTTAHD